MQEHILYYNIVAPGVEAFLVLITITDVAVNKILLKDSTKNIFLWQNGNIQ